MADILFRVHFADGAKLYVSAADATSARKSAESRNDAKILKIKRVKD